MPEQVGARKFTVSVAIKRLLNTAQYENVEIKLETTDEIEFNSMEERQRKIDKLTSALNDQYLRTQKSVLGELGVQEKRAWFKTGQAAPAGNPGPAADSLGDSL